MDKKNIFTATIAIILLFSFISVSNAEQSPANNLSNYGYVTVSSLNFREAPGINGRKIGVIKEYGFIEILESRMVDYEVWYHIDFNGKTGYVLEGYFKRLTVDEVKEFINSDNFAKGLENNNITEWEKEINISGLEQGQNSAILENQTDTSGIAEILDVQINSTVADNNFLQMSTDNLLVEYKKIRNELFKRTQNYNNDELYLVNGDDVSLYLTGDYEISKAYDESEAISLDIVGINNLGYEITVDVSASINGWDVQSFSSLKISAGNKKKGVFKLSLTDADISSYEEIDHIEFRLYITGIGHLNPIIVPFAAQ